MTVAAIWEAFCLQTRRVGGSLKAPPRTNNAALDFITDKGAAPFVLLDVEHFYRRRVDRCLCVYLEYTKLLATQNELMTLQAVPIQVLP